MNRGDRFLAFFVSHTGVDSSPIEVSNFNVQVLGAVVTRLILKLGSYCGAFFGTAFRTAATGVWVERVFRGGLNRGVGGFKHIRALAGACKVSIQAKAVAKHRMFERDEQSHHRQKDKC